MPNQASPTQLSWSNYHQPVRRIAAKFASNHGNYGIHDHEFTVANTYWRSNGTRACRTCQAIRNARRAVAS